MAYCRWSSDDYRCDLYCYEDVHGGYTTHVASSRYDWDPPNPSPYDAEEMQRLLRAEPDGAAWKRAMEGYQHKLHMAPLVPIGLAFDGQSFNDPDLVTFRQRLVDLIEAGYRVPSGLLGWIDEEIEEEAAG